MKKFLKVILLLVIAIIILIFVGQGLGILDLADFRPISSTELYKYSNYYFDRLSENEKKAYIKIDKAVDANKSYIYIWSKGEEKSDDTINKVLTAYINDYPEVFYISNKYTIVTRVIFGIKLNKLHLTYFEERAESEEKFNNALDDFLTGLINSNMTDYEKELAIHDKLIREVNYYDYNYRNEIPSSKHTAYGALVEHEAVCDGYAKAFKLLLNTVGIENIIVDGRIENVEHAWNIVKIDNEYYHVDVTSDNLEENDKKYVMHAYFNLTEEEIEKSHVISETFEIPKCINEQHNYYEYNGYILNKGENMNTIIQKIIEKNKGNAILEFKVDSIYSSRSIIDTLYNLNFNNWRTSQLRSITYSIVDNIYLFKAD